MPRGGAPQRRAPHGAPRAGGQRVDRGGQARRRRRLGLLGHARRGGPLDRRHDEPGLPAVLAGVGRAPARRRAPVRLRQGALLLGLPRGGRDLRRGRRLLALRGPAPDLRPARRARLATASSTPCSASPSWRTARRSCAHGARRAREASERRQPYRELRPRQPRSDDQDGPLRGLGAQSSASSWPSRASRCSRPPATSSTTAWPRSSSACCWRWSPWPSAATPRTCSSARRRRPRSARRSPRSSRPIAASTACSSC